MRLSRLLPARLRRRLRTAALARDAREGPAHGPLPTSSDFLHVIATRHGIGVFDEQWFAYRQLLLEHLTLASLDAQTHRDFLWVVAIDRNMPPVARKHLEALAADRPYLHLAETELKRDFVPDLVVRVREEAKARGKAWVLTTRLDDDDAIHRDLVGRLHQEAAAHLAEGRDNPAILAPTLGCNWVPTAAAGHRAYHHSPSIGLSLLEPAARAATVYRRNHSTLGQMLVPQGVSVRHLDGETLWWLYAHTGLSDQQREGSERMSKVADHAHAIALDAAMLARFGVTAEGARLLRRTPEPEPHETLHLLNRRGLDVEQEIHELREALRDKDDERLRERVAKLHAERRRMHERLIR
ncbi:putative rhamnosyl transferase [Glycomyces sp. TRM65418]|uniref:glycosyltransferase n=1 Tax=Glycomyces sp. TRM65418 TaxID=2867006 RepID=UPI001CE52FF7|nr:glycosyltransferase [Glycomyces sp. TRM65418]MCC3763521.1 putative rhamnosyl transferase [Glycomyces sp. TRM65418]QZD57505.1 putative rhamnosyl transferase [Glycomyces sp. TRM65418]